MKVVEKYILFLVCVAVSFINTSTLICFFCALSLYFVFDTRCANFLRRILSQLYLVLPCLLSIFQLYIYDVCGIVIRCYFYFLALQSVAVDFVLWGNKFGARRKAIALVYVMIVHCIVSYLLLQNIMLVAFFVIVVGIASYNFIGRSTVLGGIPIALWIIFANNYKDVIASFRIVKL